MNWQSWTVINVFCSFVVSVRFTVINLTLQNINGIDCVVYGKGAEFAMKYLKKGMKVAVCGRIQTGTYTNSGNQKIYTWGVVVEEHFFAESKNAGNRNADAAGVTDKDGFMEVPDNAEIPFA